MLAAIGAGALLAATSGCGGTSRPATGSASRTSQGAGSLVARGRALYENDGCQGCHSLDGTRMTGPSWKGLAGSLVQLSDGRTVVADDAYLTRHIVEPDAFTVRGYPNGVMAQVTGELDLKGRPADVRALVAFIDSLR